MQIGRRRRRRRRVYLFKVDGKQCYAALLRSVVN